MTQKDTYDEIFIEAFSINKDRLDDELEFETVQEWDSIGHMNLIGMIEDTFGITMDMNDIIDFSSYKKGFEILEKYGITL